MHYPVKKVLIDDIQIKPDLQARSKLSLTVVAEYVIALRGGDQFPPIVVFFDGKDYFLADGNHRLKAYKALGEVFIECEVKPGDHTTALYYVLGGSENENHGLRYSKADRKRKVELALSDPYYKTLPVRDLSQKIKVSEKLILQVKAEVGLSDPLEDIPIGDLDANDYALPTEGFEGLPRAEIEGAYSLSPNVVLLAEPSGSFDLGIQCLQGGEFSLLQSDSPVIYLLLDTGELVETVKQLPELEYGCSIFWYQNYAIAALYPLSSLAGLEDTQISALENALERLILAFSKSGDRVYVQNPPCSLVGYCTTRAIEVFSTDSDYLTMELKDALEEG